jgi:hypothetical protein
MGSVVGNIWHGLEQADPTGLATKINNAAEGTWNQNAAHGTQPVNHYQPSPAPSGNWAQQNGFENRQPTLNLPPDAAMGQGTGQRATQQSPGGWTYIPGQGPVWQGGGGNRV